MSSLRPLLEQRGFRVVELSASGTLGADFGRALGGLSSGDALLVQLASPTAIKDDALILRVPSARRAVTLQSLGDAVAMREPASVLFLVEALHDGAPNDAMLAADHADAVVRALDARARGYAVLVGVRGEDDGRGPHLDAVAAPVAWPFLDFFTRAIDDATLKDEDGGERVSSVYDRVRAMPDLSARVQSFAFVKGKIDFELTVGLRRPKTVPPPSVVPRIDGTSEGPPRRGRHLAEDAPVSQEPSSLRRPHLMPLLLGAEEACEREDWDEALDAYKTALMLVGPGDNASLATIYANIGEMKRAQGKPREAELNFEKALGAVPLHRRSIEALIDIAIAEPSPKRVVEYRLRLLPALKDDAARARALHHRGDPSERPR